MNTETIKAKYATTGDIMLGQEGREFPFTITRIERDSNSVMEFFNAEGQFVWIHANEPIRVITNRVGPF